MNDPTSPSSGVWRPTLALALLAFFLGFLLVCGGLGQVRFLWSAYQHGGL